MGNKTHYTLLSVNMGGISQEQAQGVYLLTETGFIHVPPSGHCIRVIYDEGSAADVQCPHGIDIRKRSPLRVDGWPSREGHYIVPREAAQAAEALGLKGPGCFYTLGPRMSYEKLAWDTHRWLTFWPTISQ